MKHKSIAELIIELKNADLTLRDKLVQSGLLSGGYNKEMMELHTKNAEILKLSSRYKKVCDALNARIDRAEKDGAWPKD